MIKNLYSEASDFLYKNYELGVEDLFCANACSTFFYGIEEGDDWVFRLISGSFTQFGLKNSDTIRLTDVRNTYYSNSTQSEVFGREKVRTEIRGYVTKFLAGEGDQIGFVIPIDKDSITIPGEKMWVKIEMTKVKTNKGTVISGMFSDATRFGIAYNDAIRKSYIDHTTGLFNRNTLEMHLNEADTLKGNCFVYIDIDNFRDFNNKYSYNFGDKILKYFGEQIIKLTNDDIMAYRVGSDEFFLRFKHDRVNEINDILLNLKRKLKNIVIDDNETTIFFSFGVMLSEEFTDISVNNILSTTDDYMLKHKESRKILNQPKYKIKLVNQ